MRSSRTLFLCVQVWMAGSSLTDRVSMITERGAVDRATRIDYKAARVWSPSLRLGGPTPQVVVAEGVAGVDVADAVRVAVGDRQLVVPERSTDG